MATQLSPLRYMQVINMIEVVVSGYQGQPVLDGNG
jgi:hypothetical protein